MLKQLMNHARFQLRITPLDPLLIKTGQATVAGTDMSFVRTFRHGDSQPFLPGSSLKGVVRSYCEKICRTLRPDPIPVCLPYMEERTAQTPEEQQQISCGHYMEDLESWRAYALSCPACRLFGSLKFTGRCSIADAYLDGKEYLEEVRDGVAIDRVTGGVAGGAKYDLKVLVRGKFTTTIDVRNFERWQLGLLGLVLADMEEGLVRLGMGKSRGLGRIQVTLQSLEVAYYGRPVKHLVGLAALCSDKDRHNYSLASETGGKGPDLSEPKRQGLRHVYTITETWKEHLEPAIQDLVDYVAQVPWPRRLHEEGRRAQGGGQP